MAENERLPETGDRVRTNFRDYGTVSACDDVEDGDRTYWLGDLRDQFGRKIPGSSMKVKARYIETIQPDDEPHRAD